MDEERFIEVSKSENLIPLHRTIFSDHLTPVLANRCLVKEEDREAPNIYRKQRLYLPRFHGIPLGSIQRGGSSTIHGNCSLGTQCDYIGPPCWKIDSEDGRRSDDNSSKYYQQMEARTY
ncbi:hypothetical protein KY284_026150 [Solanum tuberosum]|nr:hypothetical protein KY284_026150 [Solanum tuberosum]